jgi:hypothetical protein
VFCGQNAGSGRTTRTHAAANPLRQQISDDRFTAMGGGVIRVTLSLHQQAAPVVSYHCEIFPPNIVIL